jgi:hypothetical protein
MSEPKKGWAWVKDIGYESAVYVSDCDVAIHISRSRANADWIADLLNKYRVQAVKEAVAHERERCRRIAFDVADGKLHPPPEGTVEAFKIGHSCAANVIGDFIHWGEGQRKV